MTGLAQHSSEGFVFLGFLFFCWVQVKKNNNNKRLWNLENLVIFVGGWSNWDREVFLTISEGLPYITTSGWVVLPFCCSNLRRKNRSGIQKRTTSNSARDPSNLLQNTTMAGKSRVSDQAQTAKRHDRRGGDPLECQEDRRL